MGKLTDGFYSLFSKVNRHKYPDAEMQEGSSDLLEELRLEMSDKELIDLKDEWLKKWNLYYPDIKKKQEENEKYWLGKHFKGASVEDRPMVDNVIFEALETFLPNPGDYSFLYTGNFSSLTMKWWTSHGANIPSGMYGQEGILYNQTIWRAFKGTMIVASLCALFAGTIGTLIGYSVSKRRRSKWANYVNSVAFLPYQ